MSGIDGLGLLEVEPRGVRRHLRDIECLDHLGEGEHIAISRSGTDRERPAEKGQIVQQTFGDEAAVAVEEQVRLRIALGELAAALARHQRQVRVHGRAVADPDPVERLEQRDLPQASTAGGPRRAGRA